MLFVLLFVLLTFSGAVYAYKDQSADKAFFGTKIFGEDLGGKTQKEIQRILEKKVKRITLSFKVEGQDVNVEPGEAGVTFNTGNSAEDAVGRGKGGEWYRSWLRTASSLIYMMNNDAGKAIESEFRDNIAISYSIDDQKLSDFTQGLSSKFNVESQNAGLVMNGTDVHVIPAVYGRKIVADSVRSQIVSAIKNSASNKISIEVEKINPTILEEDTKESIESAKSLLSVPVTYRYKGKPYIPDKATIGSWIVFNVKEVNGQEKLVPEIDPKQIYGFARSISGNINIAAINKKVTIENGATSKITQEGKDGIAVDIDKIAAETAASLTAGRAVAMEVPTYVVKFKTLVNNVFVANWDKYIEINLSTQRLTAYTAGGNLVGSWVICSGKAGFATPTGTHLVRGKSSWIRMKGMQGTPEAYDLYPIKWATWFTGAGHAMHDAYWRGGHFGFPASHGCINMPDDGAAFIYNWAPVGTPVVVHY